MDGRIAIYKRKFFSYKNYNSFRGTLHPNRIVEETISNSHVPGKHLYIIRYYRNTAYLRQKFQFT